MCPTMIAGTALSAAIQKGTASPDSQSSLDWSTTGSSTWESMEVLPWPGKCLPTAITPVSASPPATQAAALAARLGSPL